MHPALHLGEAVNEQNAAFAAHLKINLTWFLAKTSPGASVHVCVCVRGRLEVSAQTDGGTLSSLFTEIPLIKHTVTAQHTHAWQHLG